MARSKGYHDVHAIPYVFFIPENEKAKIKVYWRKCSVFRALVVYRSMATLRDICTSASKRTIVYNSSLEAISAIINAHKEQEVSLKSVIVRRRQCVEIRAAKMHGAQKRAGTADSAQFPSKNRGRRHGEERKRIVSNTREAGREKSVEHP
ncbi:hypothetical protein WN48_09878 [Eufriesea mexicana]|nr:hypothetical protein WN48_09878 [Eufriesea mexicana]